MLRQAQGGGERDHRAVVGAELRFRIEHLEAARPRRGIERRAQLPVGAHAASDDQPLQAGRLQRPEALRHQHLDHGVDERAGEIRRTRLLVLDRRGHRGLQSGEAEFQVLAVQHRAWQAQASGNPRVGEARQRRPAWIAEAQELRGLVEGFSRGVVLRLPEQGVAADALDPHGKGAAKTPIKSAKQALELLEAKVAEVKGKGKGVRGGRKSRKDEWVVGPAPTPEDAETRRTRLKNLIKLGKERGFLTYSEINDHLPDDLVDAEQIEAIISTFGDMGIQVYDQAPDQETLLIASDAPPVAQPDDDVEEQAEAALSTVDSEFGRTTDPVRMYMREMGSVELLTREGEIEIAKRIEEGLRHMIQAISRVSWSGAWS